MNSCYYCKDYLVEKNQCCLFDREPETSDNDCEYFEFDTGEDAMSCEKCGLLTELFERTPRTNRDYWVMTELFVLLHDGKDHCNIQSSTPTVRKEE